MTNKTNLAQPTYNSSTWNAPLNSNFGIIDNSFGATTSISLSGSNYSLSASDVQAMRIAASGVLLANVLVLIPAGVTGFWIVTNATSGAYTVGVYSNNGSGSAAGAGVGVSQGFSAIVYSDGTNVYLADNNFSTIVPPGAIMPFGSISAPSGWLACNGAAYSRTAYAALFANIGTTWGVGDGSTTFNVPNLQGAFLRGSGSGLNPASRTVGSYEADAFASHSHTITDPGHTHNAGTPGNIAGTAYPVGTYTFLVPGSNTNATSSSTTGITGTNATGGTETVPKNFAVLYCIKA